MAREWEDILRRSTELHIRERPISMVYFSVHATLKVIL